MKSETPTTPAATPAAINLGLEIVKHLVKVFQNHLDARRWRSVRFSVRAVLARLTTCLVSPLTPPFLSNSQLHLFAHLASLPRPLVDASSLLTLLHASFILPLENEPGLRAERGDELVRVVLETLLRLSPGTGVMQAGNETLESIRTGVQTYMSARQVDRQFLGGESGNAKQWTDVGHHTFFTRVAHLLTASLVTWSIAAYRFAVPGIPLHHRHAPRLSASTVRSLPVTHCQRRKHARVRAVPAACHLSAHRERYRRHRGGCCS